MALYAFDGTGNEDTDEDIKDSNVVRFKELYNGQDVEYLAGIGTRFGTIGKAIGGIFGAGGRSRITEMLELAAENYQDGDKIIDIVGFSRGAALAVHFANEIADKGLNLGDGSVEKPKIRFLGVWDIVGSFGLAVDTIVDFQEINLGWDIDSVASCVENCRHAMSLDERRESFGLTRLDPQHERPEIIKEVWFRGVHSDIGGGNRNPDRSNIALNWMLDEAEACGVKINRQKAKLPKYSKIDHNAKISENKDPKLDPRREILSGDEVFDASKPKVLAAGESCEALVRAELKYNWAGIHLEKGHEYKISVPAGQVWQDGEIECDAAGWKSEALPWYKESIVKFFEDNRRVPEADWFELIGSYGDELEEFFRIGLGKTITAEHTVDLYLFANDLETKYRNNQGDLTVVIERIS